MAIFTVFHVVDVKKQLWKGQTVKQQWFDSETYLSQKSSESRHHPMLFIAVKCRKNDFFHSFSGY